MFTNKLAFIALAIAGMAGAGAAGAYLASRPTAPETAVAAPVEPPGDAVEATEAVVDEPAPEAEKPAAEPAPPAPKPAPRAEPTRRVRASNPPPAAPARTERRPATPAQTTAPEPVRTPPPPRSPLPGERTTAEPTLVTSPPSIDAAPVPQLPPEPEFEDLVVAANSVIGLQLERSISTETARVEDRVRATVTRDVRALGRVAIPAGSRVVGSVSEVERGGKMKERARLGVRFHTLILADGIELPMQTETVYREGDSPGNASAAKIGGGAIGGAILGAILGGGKGAAIGGAIGAGAGTTATMAGGRRPAELPAGSTVTVKLLSPVVVTVER